MTFCERIADWISGGAISRAHDELEWQKKQEDAWFRIAKEAQERAAKWLLESNEGRSAATTRLLALNAIIAQEKPTSNATVRRICRIAREALE